MLVSHDCCSALLISHLNKNCAKDRLRETLARVSREFPNCFDDVPVGINTRGTDFGKEMLDSVQVCVTMGREGKLSHSKAKFLRNFIDTMCTSH